MSNLWKQTMLPFFSLFTSLGTLVCCALPALLVTLGMGAAVAGLVSNVPWLVTLSDNKQVVFAVAGFMLFISAFMQWRSRHAPCPTDIKQAKTCIRLRKISVCILIFSIAVYCVGFFFAFFAADIFYG